MQASSLSLPCREMCEAVTSTCSCGQERTLGSLLDKVMDGLLVNLLCSIVSCSLHAGIPSPDAMCCQSSKQQSTTACAAHTAPGTCLLSNVDRRWFDSEAQLAELWQHAYLASVLPTCILARCHHCRYLVTPVNMLLRDRCPQPASSPCASTD